MLKVLLISATFLGAGTAFADEVIIHRDDAPPPPSSTTSVESHRSADGCESKTIHKENDEGDSKTVHKENCD